MGCENCGSGGSGTPAGCGDKGHCSTGGCNKLNTFDWLSHIDLPEQGNGDIIEVGFKQNARKEFFRKPHYLHVHTGDFVVVESTAGSYDIGCVSVSGELARMQMKKKRVRETAILPNVLRAANERDIERLNEARSLEKETLIKARAVARTLDLDMKVGDVEFQGDKRKVTFYYTADGRIDFRELIRIYAKEFKVKIEMRQIGARQESARIGGIGTCGRELCCSTWLGDFKSVSTVAARYQNLAINQSKLSGQCGRLKCCLNFELKSYLDALRDFPKGADRLETLRGTVVLVKTDVFKRLMFYGYQQQYSLVEIQPLTTTQVRQLIAWNQKGIKPNDLRELTPDETGAIPLPMERDADAISKQQRTSRLHRKIDQSESTTDYDAPIELPELEKNKRRKNKTRSQNPNEKGNTDRPQSERPQNERVQTDKVADKTTEGGENANRNQERNQERRPNNNQNRPNNNNRNQPRPNNNPNNNPNRQKNVNNEGGNADANSEKTNVEKTNVEKGNTEKPINTEKPHNNDKNPNRQPRPNNNPNNNNPNRQNNSNNNNPNRQNNPNNNNQPRQNKPKNNNNNNNNKPKNNNANSNENNNPKPTDTPPSE
jgi:cell fate regulator YaaT (PSP1 superfamily)